MTETELMLTFLLRCRREDLYVDTPSLTPAQEGLYRQMQIRRLSGEPIQYILGETEFMGLRFEVDRRVLIPRPETELLVEAAMGVCPRPRHILEVGTGSGNIAVSLAAYLPQAQITTLDVSRVALSLAQANARANGVLSKIRFRHCSMEDFFADSTKKELFDMLISNPPYVASRDLSRLPPEVQQEPHLALDGGEQGLAFYPALIDDGAGHLAHGGYLLLEIGEGQSRHIDSLLAESGRYQEWEFIKDYRGVERIVIARRHQ